MPLHHSHQVIQIFIVNYDRHVHRCRRIPSTFTRKIMIDGGFNVGKYTEAFLKKNSNFKVFAFEPLSFPTDVTNVTLIRKAMWIKDESRTLYLSRRSDAASLYQESRFIKINRSVSVSCIDFGAWVLANFNKNDYIHLKLDIEGAEFQVLPNMIRDGSINLISELVCEWHIDLSKNKDHQDHFSREKSSILSKLGHLRWTQDWR